MSDQRSSIIRTTHGARVRYDHGDNCAECQALGPGELEVIVRDLAASMDDPVVDLDPEVMGDYVCLACPDHDDDSPGVVHIREDFVHADGCAWRRLTDWVSAHPVSGDPQ